MMTDDHKKHFSGYHSEQMVEFWPHGEINQKGYGTVIDLKDGILWVDEIGASPGTFARRSVALQAFSTRAISGVFGRDACVRYVLEELLFIPENWVEFSGLVGDQAFLQEITRKHLLANEPSVNALDLCHWMMQNLEEGELLFELLGRYFLDLVSVYPDEFEAVLDSFDYDSYSRLWKDNIDKYLEYADEEELRFVQYRIKRMKQDLDEEEVRNEAALSLYKTLYELELNTSEDLEEELYQLIDKDAFREAFYREDGDVRGHETPMCRRVAEVNYK